MEKNEHSQSHIASPTEIANNNNINKNNNNERGSQSPCMRPRSDPPNFGPFEHGEKQNDDID